MPSELAVSPTCQLSLFDCTLKAHPCWTLCVSQGLVQVYHGDGAVHGPNATLARPTKCPGPEGSKVRKCSSRDAQGISCDLCCFGGVVGIFMLLATILSWLPIPRRLGTTRERTLIAPM